MDIFADAPCAGARIETDKVVELAEEENYAPCVGARIETDYYRDVMSGGSYAPCAGARIGITGYWGRWLLRRRKLYKYFLY